MINILRRLLRAVLVYGIKASLFINPGLELRPHVLDCALSAAGNPFFGTRRGKKLLNVGSPISQLAVARREPPAARFLFNSNTIWSLAPLVCRFLAIFFDFVDEQNDVKNVIGGKSADLILLTLGGRES